jgi:hypothetical protein
MRIRFITCMLLVYSLCNAQTTKKNEWRKEELKGRVKMLKQTLYMYFAPGETGEGFNPNDHSVDSFSKDGMKKWSYYLKDGAKSSYTVYKYDPKGLLTEFVQISEKDTSRTVYKYDAMGNELLQVSYTGKKETSKSTNKYDAKGYLIESKLYGTLGMKWEYKNDEKGYAVEVKTYDDKGAYNGKSTYINDAAGKQVEGTSYDKSGAFVNRRATKYDEQGNETEVIIFDKDGNQKRESYNEYTYDAQGNWLTIKQYLEDKLSGGFYRVIEYY